MTVARVYSSADKAPLNKDQQTNKHINLILLFLQKKTDYQTTLSHRPRKCPCGQLFQISE